MNLEHICYGCFQEKPDGYPFCPNCGFNANAEQPFLALPLGTLLNGRYMTGKVLGVGGFGITYLGYDLTLEIKVAIKEYMPSGLAARHSDKYNVALTGRRQEDYQNGMKRFLEEARILAKLQNTPNIVSVQNYFKENNTAYFVMEYIDGMSLKAYLDSQGGRIPYDQALAILMPVMQALSQVHAMNLTHRDISPDNIYMTYNGESKLLDFGAARFSVGDDKSMSVILKHGYAPAEQYSSRGNQGPWTDVYAMGATLYRCVTGILPPESIIRTHNDTLKKPSELGVYLPPQVEWAIMTALAVNAENRFPTMDAFIGGITGNNSPSPLYYQNMTVPAAQMTVPAAQMTGAAAQMTGAAVQMAANPDRKPGLWTRFRQSPIGIQITALVLCIAVLGLGIWGVAAGIGALVRRNDKPGTDISKATTQESTMQEPATQNPTAQEPTAQNPTVQEPVGTDNVALQSYEDYWYLNFTMGIPEGYEEKEDDSNTRKFVSSDGSAAIQVEFYKYDAQFPVYSLSDVEINAEKYVQYYINQLENTDITKYEIIGRGYHNIASQQSYQIQFLITESNGTTWEFIAAFIECQNGFGCYNFTASYPQGDAKAKAEVFAAMNSFQSSKPIHTNWSLYSDERYPFKFLYWTKDADISYEFVNENRLKIDLSYETFNRSMEVQCKPLTGQLTRESWLDVVAEETSKKSGYDRLYNGDRLRCTRGGVEWLVDGYSYTAEGQTTYLDFYTAEIDGYVFGVIISAESEEALDEEYLVLNITNTIRPVK